MSHPRTLIDLIKDGYTTEKEAGVFGKPLQEKLNNIYANFCNSLAELLKKDFDYLSELDDFQRYMAYRSLIDGVGNSIVSIEIGMDILEREISDEEMDGLHRIKSFHWYQIHDLLTEECSLLSKMGSGEDIDTLFVDKIYPYHSYHEYISKRYEE